MPRRARDIEAPPSYDEATDPDAPPPTYESLFGQLRQASSASGFASTLRSIWLVCCGSMVAIAILCLSTILPLAMVVMGIVHVSDCPDEPWIPIYLMVAGSLSLLKLVLNTGFRLRQRRAGVQNPTGSPTWVDSLLNLLIFGWFIAGSVFVYRYFDKITEREEATGEQTTMEPPLSCDPSLFYFAFAVVTLGWVLLAVFFCFCGSLAMCFCILILWRDEGRVERRTWDNPTGDEPGVESEDAARQKEQYIRQEMENVPHYGTSEQ